MNYGYPGGSSYPGSYGYRGRSNYGYPPEEGAWPREQYAYGYGSGLGTSRGELVYAGGGGWEPE